MFKYKILDKWEENICMELLLIFSFLYIYNNFLWWFEFGISIFLIIMFVRIICIIIILNNKICICYYKNYIMIRMVDN